MKFNFIINIFYLIKIKCVFIQKITQHILICKENIININRFIKFNAFKIFIKKLFKRRKFCFIIE